MVDKWMYCKVNCCCVFLRAETGFKHVKPTEYTPRLLQFHGNKVGVAEVW